MDSWGNICYPRSFKNRAMKLSDRVIVITGSTRGIGRAIAGACAEEGARVVICSRDPKAVKRTCSDLKKKGHEVSGITVDVSKRGDLEKLLKHAVDAWGNVDVWINNAGLSGGLRYIGDTKRHEIQRIVDVNLTATIDACRLLIPYFLKQGKGIIINMSGRGGRGEASPYLSVYAATKAAVSSLTRSLAKEYRKQHLSINSVIPGMVETDFYEDVEVSPGLEPMAKSVPYVLKAFGVPVEKAGRLFVNIAAQEPGRNTGKTYSPLGGLGVMRGIALISWYRLTGKIKGEM